MLLVFFTVDGEMTIMKKQKYFREKSAAQIGIQNFLILNIGSKILKHLAGQIIRLGAEFGSAGHQHVT